MPGDEHKQGERGKQTCYASSSARISQVVGRQIAAFGEIAVTAVVQGGALVPHHQIPHAPSMAINEFTLGGVFHRFGNQHPFPGYRNVGNMRAIHADEQDLDRDRICRLLDIRGRNRRARIDTAGLCSI